MIFPWPLLFGKTCEKKRGNRVENLDKAWPGQYT